MARHPNQVSMPNPEFGVDFDASARAMHQSASKGSLMVHEKARFGAAVVRKSLAATMFERNTMLKTLKRKIALVAVAGLGFGLVSTVPAFAAALTATGGTGNTVRAAVAGQALTTVTTGANVQADADTLSAQVLTGPAGATITFTNITGGNAADNHADQTATVGGAAVTITEAAATNWAATTGTPTLTLVGQVSAVGVYTVRFGTTTTHTVTITAVGAPVAVKFSQSSRTQVGVSVPADQNAANEVVVTALDTNGNNTYLLSPETISLGTTSTLVGDDQRIEEGGADTAVTSIDHNTANQSIAQANVSTGVTIGLANVNNNHTYTILAQLASGGNAIGNPVTYTQRYVSSTAGLTGTLTLHDNADTTIAKTRIAVAPAGADTFKVKAVDSNGYPISGLVISTSDTGTGGTFGAASVTTGVDGISGTATYTAGNTGGAYTITASYTAGAAGTVSVTLPVTITSFGATNITAANAKAVNTTGTGWVVGTAPAYTAGLSVTAVRVTITGLDANKSAAIAATATTGALSTIAIDTGATPVADSTGKIEAVVSFTAVDADDVLTVTLDHNGDAAGLVSVAVVTFKAAAYTLTLTSPATNPSIATTGAAITVAGKVADQFGALIQGATVVVTGAQTVSSGTTPTALTLTRVTGADGTFSGSFAAASALTTTVSITATASLGNLTITGVTTPVIVNLNAGGGATAITFTDNDAASDADTATTATTMPLTKVAYLGTTEGISNEIYTVATPTAVVDIDSADVCVQLTPTTTPGAQVKATSTTGVLFYTTCAGTETIAAGKTELEVASGANIFAVATKVGLNSVLLTSGTVSKTAQFWAVNYLDAGGAWNPGDAARTVEVTPTRSLSAGEIGFITITVRDNFGNPVQQTAGSTVSVRITGAALLDGPALSKTGLTADAAGEIVVGIIAGNVAGTATVTVTGVGGDFTDAAGAINSTTAGTNGLKAGVATATSAITVTAGTSKTDTEITAVKTDVKAVSDTVATLSKAVTTIQSSVTELTSSFSAQIKSLSSAIAKISRAIAALSKRIK